MMINDFNVLPVVSWIHKDSLSTLEAWLKERDFTIFEINGNGVADDDTLFESFRNLLPMDPPLGTSVGWNSFADSLWGGLVDLECNLIAIIWLNVENMFDHGIPDLYDAVQIFMSLARDFSTFKDEKNILRSKVLKLFLVGKGPNFVKFTVPQ